MGYDDEAPSGETNEQVQARLGAFAIKLHSLIAGEPYTSGVGGTLVGYAFGLMLSQGATESDLRETYDKILAGVLAGQAAVLEHERKTLS